MKFGAVEMIGGAVVVAASLSACSRQADVAPPTLVQFTCSFEPAAPMTVVIDTGLRSARWMNLPAPREGSASVSSHQYQIEFPALDDAPQVHARVNRYDATILRTSGDGATAVRQTGRCVKDETGPRL